MTPVVYLHGFASSPQSAKAQFFRRKFAERGTEIEIPRLDEGNFEGLTITGQLAAIERTVAGRRVGLIGSSLGGYLAAAFAARHPHVEWLALMAPAFQFPRRWRERFSPEELAEWKREGSRPFFHYGYKEGRPLGYAFIEDAAQYEDQPEFSQPALILHGTEDAVVPAEVSREFAAAHPNVTLRLLRSGHELTDVLDELWTEILKFVKTFTGPK